MKSDAIKQFWPLGQSMDLVRGVARDVAVAVETEVRRFIDPDPLNLSEVDFGSIASVFDSVPVFTNIPTLFFVFPTFSEWAVLWNNSFLCDGYDSLCSCLTANHGLDTLHWTAHDDNTTFQAGSSFTFRSQHDGILSERSVYVGNNDGTWTFFESGTALPEEDLSLYEARLKRNRLNESLLMQLLSRLGASPWSDDWYDLSNKYFFLKRTKYSDTVLERTIGEVITSNV